MVQMGDSHANMNAQPFGQVVRFSSSEKMNDPLFLLDEAVPTGMAMIVPRINATFCFQLLEKLSVPFEAHSRTMKTEKLCNRPIIFDSVDARIPCVSTVTMNTTYMSPNTAFS